MRVFVDFVMVDLAICGTATLTLIAAIVYYRHFVSKRPRDPQRCTFCNRFFEARINDILRCSCGARRPR